MLAAERQAKITELIAERGSALVEDLAQELNVSTMTIRRDLAKLQADGLAERCHGGAVAKQEISYKDKMTSHKKEKEKIADLCSTYVKEGEIVFLDAGTTTYEIARRIMNIDNIMIITNDLEIANLVKNSEADLFMCGGNVQKSTGSTYGHYTENMLADFRFDKGFFGAASIDYGFEVTTPTIEKMCLKRETLKHCDEAYLVVDESKFYKRSVVRINHLGDYTAVITNKRFDKKEAEKLRILGAKIIPVVLPEA